MKFVLPMLAASVLAVAATPASAVTIFNATLSGANETVPNTSTATGIGLLQLSDDQNSIAVNLDWVTLTSPATGAHIHCCAFQGANGPIAVDFNIVPVSVTTAGLGAVRNLTLATTYSAGFLAANGGTAESARTAFLNGLLGGKAYFNVHTATYPSGEIRGQLAAVPESGTWGMMIAGFGLVGGAMRLRRRSALPA
jgi:hypothetical protein